GEGLPVERADLHACLEGLEDGSLGGVFAGQVVEHLPPPALVLLLERAAAKLRPGGLFVAETINPLSPLALRYYFSDLTHAEQLVDELNARDHLATLVTVPFMWYPGTRVLSQAFLWRLVDLEETDGRPIDLVIGTKFPSYVVRHRRKVVWLVHQFRQAYDLD